MLTEYQYIALSCGKDSSELHLVQYGLYLFPYHVSVADLPENTTHPFIHHTLPVISTTEEEFDLLCLESSLADSCWYLLKNESEVDEQHLVTHSRLVLNSTLHTVDTVTVYRSEKMRKIESGKTQLLPDDKQHHRTLLWLGRENFAKIKQTSILCIGSGGTMNPFLTQAMHMGFQHFAIVEKDTIEESNLNRFYGGTRQHIGRKKADVMKGIITSYNPEAAVRVIDSYFPEKESWKELITHDIIVCGVDNNYARYMTQLYACMFGKPLFDMGSGIFADIEENSIELEEMGGQVKVSVPGCACLVCMGMDPADIRDPKRMELDRREGILPVQI